MLTLHQLENEVQLGQIEELKRKSTLWTGSPLYVVAHSYFYRDHSDIYCLQNDDIVIGVVVLGRAREGRHGVCEFTDLVIGDEYLGKGFGKAAVALIINEYKQRSDCKRIKLCVHEANDIACHIYQNAGFRITGRAEWDKHFVNMEFEL